MNRNNKIDIKLTKIYLKKVFIKRTFSAIIEGLRMSRLPKGVCYEQH